MLTNYKHTLLIIFAMNYRRIIAALCLSVLAASAWARTPQKVDTADRGMTPRQLSRKYTGEELKRDRLQNSHKTFFVGSEPTTSQDSLEYLMSRFYYDQYRHFQEPMAPYFMMMSKDATFALGVGGCIRMRGYFDFCGSVPTDGFAPYNIPVPPNPAQRRQLNGTMDGTSIYMRVIGRNDCIGDILGFIKGKFDQNNKFKLDRAYVQLRSFTLGYANSTFEDPGAEAPTIDGAGQNGSTGTSRVLIRWDHDFKDKPWSMAAALENPANQVDADGVQTQKIHDWFPDVVAFGQYSWGLEEHVRLSGLLRVLPYRDLVAGKNRARMGWGVQLSAKVSPIAPLNLYFEANTGQGYLSNMGDLSLGDYDLVCDATTPGRLYAPFAMGLNFGVKYHYLPNLYSGLALAEARYFPRYKVEPTEYKYGLYGAISLFYEPVPRMVFGIEYVTGSRHNFNGEHASANRIDAVFQLDF